MILWLPSAFLKHFYVSKLPVTIYFQSGMCEILLPFVLRASVNNVCEIASLKSCIVTTFYSVALIKLYKTVLFIDQHRCYNKNTAQISHHVLVP